jgi:hypothetical protein
MNSQLAALSRSYFPSLRMAAGYLMPQMDIKRLQHRHWAIPFT